MTNSNEQHDFDDIRPYNDSELPTVMARLLDDPELANTLLSIKHPILCRYLGWALRPYLRRILHKRFDTINCINDLQLLIAEQMKKMMEKEGLKLSISGIENLDSSTAYLFISNHRDIAMDPAFVGYSLFINNFNTVRIAIGDNLLTRPFASDLMRLNKSFIVRRSATARREKLKALKNLSAYIRHSLEEDNEHIWIAQREGRAKDGLDRTDTALLKMLGFSKGAKQTFAEGMSDLRVVPVAISYMFDPCDVDKAKEIDQRRRTGDYQKSEHEDLQSLFNGIVGNKGAVHVAFGEQISQIDDVEDLARQIDCQILSHYGLHPTNIIAWQRLNGPDTRVSTLKRRFPAAQWPELENQLMARVAHQTEGIRRAFLESYGNPVQSYLDVTRRRAVAENVTKSTANTTASVNASAVPAANVGKGEPIG